jgi:competence protein ComEC
LWGMLGYSLAGVHSVVPTDSYTHFEENNSYQMVWAKIEEQKNSNDKNRKYFAEIEVVSYKNQQISTSGKVLLLLNKQKFNSVLTQGNRYQMLVKFREISPPKNPHQFDYQKFLNRQKILRMASVDEILSQEAHSSLWFKIKDFNQKVSQKVDESSLRSDSKEFLKAFLLGDRSEMKQDNINAYSRAGVIHLIAISGMHVAFIFGMIFWILKFSLGRKNRRITILTSLVFVWLFGCFVGLTASVFRACLMITIFYFFELLKRPSNLYHSLSLSALIILIFNTNEFYSVGFQLSYAAVFFMAWLAPPIFKFLKTSKTKLNDWFIEPLSITLAAQLGTMPFVMFYFHQFSLMSVPANMLLIPYSFLITYFSVIEIFTMFVPIFIQHFFNIVYDFLIQILIDGTHWISSLKMFLFQRISLNIFELIFLISAIILLKYFLSKPEMKTVFPVLVFLLLFQTVRFTEYYLSSQKENFIVFYDYQNPLLGFRYGRNILIFKDLKSDSAQTEKFVTDPYLTGERIENEENKTLNYNETYQWENLKIQVINKDFSKIEDSVDYLIVSGDIPFSEKMFSAKEIIFTGNTHPTYWENMKPRMKTAKLSVWNTQIQGSFTVDFPLR